MENILAKYDKQIFEFLLQKHLEAKAKGEEFYFLLNPRIGHKGRGEVEGQFYWLDRADRDNKDNEIRLNFWDNHYSGIYFRIEKIENTYQCDCVMYINPDYFRHYPNGKSEKIENIAKDLQVSGGLRRRSPYGLQDYVKSYPIQTDIFAGITHFITGDKQKIDDFILQYDKDTQTSKSPCLISKEDFEYQLRLGYFLKEQQSLPIIENTLPLAISRFFVQKYEAIKDIEIGYIPPTTQWIFLTGENAKGKTTILETLWQALLTGEAFKQNYLVGFGVCIEVYEQGKYRQADCYSKKEHFTPNPVYTQNQLNIWGGGLHLSKVVAFGSSRISTQKEYVKGKNPFGNEPFLLDINKELFKRKISEKYRYQFDILESAFKELLPQLSHIEIDINELEDRKKVLYYEKDEDENTLGKVFFEQLAAGYQNIINLIGNIIFALSEEIEGNIHLKSPQELYGIVIIDEFELHLHPKMQRFLVEKLTELFPKVQFIVSTHSPIPLLGAPKESVILHVDRTKEAGITVERLDIDFQHLLPEAILSSPIFEFDSFLKRNGESFEKFSTENDYNEIVFDKMLEEKLGKLAAEGGKKLLDILNKNK